MKRQRALYGAAVLALAGVAVKILGALFKIPLGALLGPEGNGIFSIAYNIYALIFVLATAGLPTAMSKTVAEAEACGKNTKEILKKALPPFGITGAVASAILIIGGKYLAEAMGAPSAGGAIAAIAPGIFFVSIAAVLRGYFQGLGNMTPTAVSEVIEAGGKLLFGIALSYFILKNGGKVWQVASGAAFGVTLGAFLSMLFLGIKGRCAGTNHWGTRDEKVMGKIIKTAIPITAGASIVSLGNVIDSALIMNILPEGERALWLFGAYNYAATVFNLPGFLVTTLGISLVPTVSASCVLGKYNETSKLCERSMKIMLSISIAASGGLFVLSEPIIAFYIAVWTAQRPWYPHSFLKL